MVQYTHQDDALIIKIMDLPRKIDSQAGERSKVQKLALYAQKLYLIKTSVAPHVHLEQR